MIAAPARAINILRFAITTAVPGQQLRILRGNVAHISCPALHGLRIVANKRLSEYRKRKKFRQAIVEAARPTAVAGLGGEVIPRLSPESCGGTPVFGTGLPPSEIRSTLKPVAGAG
jgi:hypothetical protein